MAGRVIPLLGKTYGKLTVTEYLGHQIWRTKCACGGSRDVVGSLLRGGSARACFECTPPRSTGRPKAEDLVGQVFTQLTVERYLGHRVYQCKCSCGNTREAMAHSLKAGQVKRCEQCRKELTAFSRAGVSTDT